MGSRGQILEIEPRALYVLSKYSTLNQIPSPSCLYKSFGDIGMTCVVELQGTPTSGQPWRDQQTL